MFGWELGWLNVYMMYEMWCGFFWIVGGCVGCIFCYGMGNVVLDDMYCVCLNDLVYKW